MRIRHLFIPAIAVSTLALTAVFASHNNARALSCARPEITRSFEQWNSSPKQYVLVRGVMTATLPLPQPPAPSGDINNPTPPEPHLFRFSGRTITRSGGREWSGPVMVVPTCLAAWCGGYIKSGREAIMAFEASGPNYKLDMGPCGGQVFTGDLDASEAVLRACLKGNCPAPAH